MPSYHYRGSVSYVTGTHSFKVGFQDAVGYILNAVYTPLVQPMAFRSKTTQPDPNVRSSRGTRTGTR